jgi:glycosyltransferase involved in cell wall biosynthesis
MEYKFISCKCITYGRVGVLEEAISSFLKQDYPQAMCELILVNDYPLQTLRLAFDIPNIKIYNLNKTFETIGEKENYAIERCKGDIIAVWDDDDVALSNHLSNINKYWKDDSNLLHWGKGVYYNEPNITALTSLGNSGIVYSKRAWEEIGKSPLVNAGGDMILVTKLHELGRDKVVIAFPEDEEVSWFYRWSMPSDQIFHQSGAGTDTPDRPNIIQRHSAHIEKLRLQGHIPTGDIVLFPEWKHNYKIMLKEFNLKEK